MGVPSGIGIASIAPVPARGSQRISLTNLPGEVVSLEVIDVSGRRVRQLVSGGLPDANTTITWDGKGDRGQRLPAGVYLYRLTWSSGSETRRTLLLR